MSFPLLNQKIAAYNSMVYRLRVHLSPDNYKKEVNTIKYIATTNEEESNIVDKLIPWKKNRPKNQWKRDSKDHSSRLVNYLIDCTAKT